MRAAMGATPSFFLSTVLLPAGQATPELAEEILRSIHEAAAGLGVGACGCGPEAEGDDDADRHESPVDDASPPAAGTSAGGCAHDDGSRRSTASPPGRSVKPTDRYRARAASLPGCVLTRAVVAPRRASQRRASSSRVRPRALP